MKLLKIGSSAACGIVINSQYVSGHHADITLLDNGDILIEDKGSRNGTFVGPDRRRLIPGNEEKIRRGDRVEFGNVCLNWNQIPAPDNNSNYAQVINIGSGFRNDLVIKGNSVSRYHAALKIDKKKNAYIVDNDSTNGTKVNGLKIAPNTPVRIKRGDNVVLGDSDITSQIQNFIPQKGGWIKWVAGTAACIALVACAVWAILSIKPADPKNSVVYVLNRYHYVVTLKDNPLNVPLELEIGNFVAQGTAFHIDNKGTLGTARHVAMPWIEAYSKEQVDYIKEQLFLEVDEALQSDEGFSRFVSSPLGQQILGTVNSWKEVRTVLADIHKGSINISGASDDILIGYPGQKYTHVDDFDRATLVAESGSNDKDVALLQLNKMKNPVFSKECKPLNVDNLYTKQLKPQTEEFFITGYPAGISRATDEYDKQMQPTVYTSKVGKEPAKYTFELATGVAGGASGSPVYSKDGKLVGLLSSTYVGNGATSSVVHAKYLKELYDKEVR